MNVILISSIVRYLLYLREDLPLLITLTAAVVILLSDTILVSRHSAYAQESVIRTNPISPTDGYTSQQQIPEGQQLIVIPSLSPDNINTSIEQPEAIVEDTEQGQGLGQELTTQETTTDVIEESREQVADELDSQIQREMMQQEQEEKEVEILEQLEDREQEMQEGLDEATRTTTSNPIEEEEEEEQNNEQDDNNMEEERKDNSNDANNEIPLELPFP